MLELQKRLQDTEAQMTRIMQAMQNVSSKVTTVADGDKDGEIKDEVAANTPSTPTDQVTNSFVSYTTTKLIKLLDRSLLLSHYCIWTCSFRISQK